MRMKMAELRWLLFALAFLGLSSEVVSQESPHGPLALPCITCHSTESWAVDLVKARFDHAQTGFPLTGQHMAVSCRQCHVSLKFSTTPQRCSSCHEDIHRGELGLACDRCHSPQSWLVNDMPRRHAQTLFPLTGRHLAVSCEECHVQQQKHQYTGLSIACYSCHKKDYVATVTPPHAATGIGTECANCHSPQAISWGGNFNHEQTGFFLLGAHVQLGCNACHTANRFGGTPRDCYGCHQKDYAETANPAHAAAGFGTNCVQCHAANSMTWGTSFNHSQTGFPLTGAHTSVACITCHPGGRFAGTPTDCYSCHQSDYAGTANPSHAAAGFGTNCVQCHAANSMTWATSFNHSQTGFPLTGAHSSVACITCHPGGRFAGTPTDCYSCHQQDYASASNPLHTPASFPTTCVTCHTTTAWSPSTFNHTYYFPISSTSTHRPGRWNACSDCHTNPTNYMVFTCLTCHAQNRMDSEHSGRPGYQYVSSACYSCHPRGN
jgi:hypothetical protein